MNEDLKLFLTIAGYTAGFILASLLFLLATQDLNDKESKTSLLTKSLEALYVIAFVGAIIGGIIMGFIKFVGWIL